MQVNKISAYNCGTKQPSNTRPAFQAKVSEQSLIYIKSQLKKTLHGTDIIKARNYLENIGKFGDSATEIAAFPNDPNLYIKNNNILGDIFHRMGKSDKVVKNLEKNIMKGERDLLADFLNNDSIYFNNTRNGKSTVYRDFVENKFTKLDEKTQKRFETDVELAPYLIMQDKISR